MGIDFSKYQGTGNDFILIDNRERVFPKDINVIQKLCDRRFGIGSDGLILIEDHSQYDYRMVYFNPDGSQSLCGNGSRCGFAFAKALGMVDSKAVFETTDGVHEIKMEDGLVHFRLFDLQGIGPVAEDGYLNTGSPHYVRFVDEVKQVDVVKEGRRIRNRQEYCSQNGTNVNFAQLLTGRVKMRTYERGVEDETLSCGTGATAVALVCSYKGLNSPVDIETEGGNLKVFFSQNKDWFTDIWLAGPAEKVFEGTVNL